MRDAIHKELERLKTEPVSDAELERYKARTKADKLRGLDDNAGLAEQLATYQTFYGDWRVMFSEIAKIDAVTKADIQRVANKIFVDTNRTIGKIEFAAPQAPAASAPGNKGVGNE